MHKNHPERSSGGIGEIPPLHRGVNRERHPLANGCPGLRIRRKYRIPRKIPILLIRHIPFPKYNLIYGFGALPLRGGITPSALCQAIERSAEGAELVLSGPWRGIPWIDR